MTKYDSVRHLANAVELKLKQKYWLVLKEKPYLFCAKSDKHILIWCVAYYDLQSVYDKQQYIKRALLYKLDPWVAYYDKRKNLHIKSMLKNEVIE